MTHDKVKGVTLSSYRLGDDAAVDADVRAMDAARPSIALVTNLEDDDSGRRLFEIFGSKIRAYRTMQHLERYGNEDVLLSFSTSLIIPPEIYSRFPRGAYNLHAASPEFPGRDPHHWAIYEGAKRYGATLHVMAELVDAGPIIDTEMFDVHHGATPQGLLDLANDAAYKLLQRHAPMMLRGERLKPQGDLHWTGKKHSRKDFLAMCRVSPDISSDEFARRYRAFDGGEYSNLTLELHGKTFRIEK